MNKKLLFVTIAVLCIRAINGMEPEIEREFQAFTVKFHNPSEDTRDEVCKKLDADLGLVMPERNLPYCSIHQVLAHALSMEDENIAAVPLGDNGNKVALAFLKIYKTIKIYDDGRLDFYAAVHKFREEFPNLKHLVTKKNRPISVPNNSGSILQYVMPTITYSSAFLGGIGALKLYQWYRAR
jgi:hypothetical protein